MESYKDKNVKLNIKYKDKELYFTALVIDVNDTHITFLDKYGDIYTFKKKYIEEISPI